MKEVINERLDNELEQEKARIYTQLYSRYDKSEVTPFLLSHFLLEQVAAANVLLREMSKFIVKMGEILYANDDLNGKDQAHDEPSEAGSALSVSDTQ